MSKPMILDRAFKTSRKTQRRNVFFRLMFGKIQSDQALSAFEQGYFDSLIEKDRRKTSFLRQVMDV